MIDFWSVQCRFYPAGAASLGLTTLHISGVLLATVPLAVGSTGSPQRSRPALCWLIHTTRREVSARVTSLDRAELNDQPKAVKASMWHINAGTTLAGTSRADPDEPAGHVALAEARQGVPFALSDPDWASFTLGVFICSTCSGIHRGISQISKVKSVQLDAWEPVEVEFIASTGNDAAKAKYEQKVPPFYYRPTASDCQVLKDQWIRARYARKEFIYTERQEPYSAGYREGVLWKRGRDNGQFLSRKFILSEREGVFKYFNKHDAREPKAVMKIECLNATFQPVKIGNPNGLQVTYLKDNSTRNIFVYHEDGKEVVDWFNAIRAARFHYLQVAFPGASDVDLVPKLTRNYIKEGYMEKTGPKDAYARGEVFIGSKENHYLVLSGLPPSTQGYHWQHGITIVTPDRKFLFTCETEFEQHLWIEAFQKAINRPMLPQEYAGLPGRRSYWSFGRLARVSISRLGKWQP
ncbi:ADAP1 protein, partial [Polypterus senegalus]